MENNKSIEESPTVKTPDAEFLNITDSVLESPGKLYTFAVPENLDAERKRVFGDEFKPNKEALAKLETFSFNVKDYKSEVAMQLVMVMFDKYDLLKAVNIPREGFQNFIVALPLSYRSPSVIPFHNFLHAFTVTQMLYICLTTGEADKEMDKWEMFCLLLSSLTHDLDHPGFNNGYHNSRITSLSLLYNNQSPLENHHCACAFKLFLDPQILLFRDHNQPSLHKFRSKMIKLILATDLASHGAIMAQVNAMINEHGGKLPPLDKRTEEQKDLILILLLKSADISNETRPFDVARSWAERLLEEFFHQGDVERDQGLNVTPFMDRTKVTLKGAQIGFIQFFLIPTFEALVKMFPKVKEGLDNIRANTVKYEALDQNLGDCKDK